MEECTGMDEARRQREGDVVARYLVIHVEEETVEADSDEEAINIVKQIGWSLPCEDWTAERLPE